MYANGEWRKEPSKRARRGRGASKWIVSDSSRAWEGKNEMEKKKRRRDGIIGGGQQLRVNN